MKLILRDPTGAKVLEKSFTSVREAHAQLRLALQAHRRFYTDIRHYSVLEVHGFKIKTHELSPARKYSAVVFDKCDLKLEQLTGCRFPTFIFAPSTRMHVACVS